MDGTFLIGIDDTDCGESIGTGALARELVIHLERELGARSRGVTRHQLLVHPDIPYTSHNSSACLCVECARDAGAVEEACASFLSLLPHEGADPGLCVAAGDMRDAALLGFSRDAKTRIVTKEDAVALARTRGLGLRELGGTGLGVIGALAACGLRASGDDGRFISLAGIRSVGPEATVQEILDGTGIEDVVDESGARVDRGSRVVTNDWVRPDLVGGRAVLVLTRANGAYTIDKLKRKQMP